MNRKILAGFFTTISLATLLVACGAGDNNNNNTVTPNPFPPSGSYNGTPYANLPQPNQNPNGVLQKTYPINYFPNSLTSSNNLQIAYGNNDESNVTNLAAFVNITSNSSICSATPVKYDQNSDTTFLIGAAHCFVLNKTNQNILQRQNIASTGSLQIIKGTSVYPGATRTIYNVKAVYLLKNYCYGATFTGIKGDECPNFTPSSGVSGGQGNDIAIIQIYGQFGGVSAPAYPAVVPAIQYPQTYTMAPVLSVGYGFFTQVPNGNLPNGCTAGQNCEVMYYVANYQYQTSDAIGYHYLLNSFYNTSAFGQSGYSSLICGGDSGGGDLFWTGESWILLSEHTYGPAGVCGTFYNYLPNGATNVSAYYDWIESVFAYPESAVSRCGNDIPNCVTNG